MPETPICVLLIEDDPAEGQLLTKVLVELPGMTTIQAGSYQEALRQLAGRQVDVALLDLTLPDVPGLAAVHQLREAAPALPIVALSDHSDEHLALQAIREGAQDYLVKGELRGRLLARVI